MEAGSCRVERDVVRQAIVSAQFGDETEQQFSGACRLVRTELAVLGQPILELVCSAGAQRDHETRSAASGRNRRVPPSTTYSTTVENVAMMTGRMIAIGHVAAGGAIADSANAAATEAANGTT